MPSQLLDLARSYKSQLERQDEQALKRLVDAYRLMWDRLEGKVDALLLQIEKDGITSGVTKLARYQSMMAQLEDEMARFQSFLRTELDLSTQNSMRLGLAHSRYMTQALLKEAGITAQLQTLPVNAIKTLLGFLQDDSPLYDRIKLLTGAEAVRVREALLEGIGLGEGPRATASRIQDAFGMGLTDALRMTRTADLWAYREAARANYSANSDIVSGWMWWAELDGDTCGVCISEHGSIHDLSEELDGHYNCRCAAIPYIEGLSEQAQSGQDWFDAQTEETQRGVLGKGKYEAWKEGKFTLGDLVSHVENDTYGRMISERTLESLLAESE